MAEYKRLPLSKILLGNRRRAIDAAHAAVIGASMREHGQLQPILVRPTPAAERPYTLVVGGHRCAGAEIEQFDELDAIVIKASTAEAQMMEIAENLHRKELSVLDRAYFVQAYRELSEAKYGKITPGGDHRAKLALWSGEDASGFTQAVADRLGLSQRSAKRLGQISGKLHPDLRSALQSLPAANNQAQLLSLAKLEPAKQRQMAKALGGEPDVRKALAIIAPAPRLKRAQIDQAELLSRLVSAWEDASEATREQFLDHIGLSDTSGDLAGLMHQIRSEAA